MAVAHSFCAPGSAAPVANAKMQNKDDVNDDFPFKRDDQIEYITSILHRLNAQDKRTAPEQKYN